MKQQEHRQVALGAARSQARRRHIDPVSMSADDALAILDGLYQLDKQLIASLWYGQASDAQIKVFKREWNAWKKEQARYVV